MQNKKIVWGVWLMTVFSQSVFANSNNNANNAHLSYGPKSNSQVVGERKLHEFNKIGNTLRKGTETVADGTVLALPIPKAPEHLDFDKLNKPRACSPAEKAAGKTKCYTCDTDVPNIVAPYNVNQRNDALSKGAEILRLRSDDILLQTAGNSPTAQYNRFIGHWNQTGKATLFRVPEWEKQWREKSCGIHSINGKNKECNEYFVFRGYNLNGEHPVFKPFNNRTMCETLRPKYPTIADAAAKKDYSGLRGAAVLGIGGMVIKDLGIINRMKDARGNFGTPEKLGGPSTQTNRSAAGKDADQIIKQGTSPNATGPQRMAAANAMSYSNIVTEMFACLEYYTNSNTTRPGGDHLMLNATDSTKCMQPMAQYYNTYVAEVYPYLVDGVTDGIYEPLTRPLRYMLLLTNPFIMYGQTMPESYKIAYQRPMWPM